MIDNKQPTPQDIEGAPTHESDDIERAQGYSESQPGLGRTNDSGEVNEQQPSWRPGDEPAGANAFQGESEPGRSELDRTGDVDDVAPSRSDNANA